MSLSGVTCAAGPASLRWGRARRRGRFRALSRARARTGGTAPDALPNVTKMPRRARHASEICGVSRVARAQTLGLGNIRRDRARARAYLPRREADAVDDGLDALAARDLHDLRRDVDRRVVLVPARARRRVVARRQSAFGVPAARARNEAPSPSRATLGSICIRFSFSRARGASKFN